MDNLNKLSLKKKIGQMIGLAFFGDEYNEQLKKQVEEFNVGLLIYFKDNCTSLERIYNLNKEINKHAEIKPFIALDQEGGMVARVTEGITQSPGAMAISATHNPKNAYHLAYNMGKELRNLGFNFNFAPEADINNNPLNPVINVRSYSDNPEDVCTYMHEAVKGYDDALLMTSLKHYPGHGDTSVDSHIGLPVVNKSTKELEKLELVPFQYAAENKLPGIMVSHVLYPELENYPATMSNILVEKLLRNKIGYDGLLVTDSLTMKAVWGRYPLEEIVEKTFNSGCDIMLICGPRNLEDQERFINTAVELTEKGIIDINRINASVKRILDYKKRYKVGEMSNTFEDIKPTLMDKKAVRYSEEVAEKSITAVKLDKQILPITKQNKTLIVFPVIKVVTLVDNDDSTLNCLADYFDFAVDRFYISIDPTIEEAEKLKTLIKNNNYDRVIYCSYNALLNKTQADLINELNSSNLIVVSLRTPYDINVLNVNNYLCAYEASVLSFKAIAKVLTGKVKPTGKLPIKL